MKSWFQSLAAAPAPLTPRQRAAVAVAAVAAAVSRCAAVAMTPWDWDEMLFMLAMRHYDVAAHHPHPPGFPLWIAAADLLRACGVSDFRALQALALLGGAAIVPATFFLCRELRMRFSTSLGAAVVLAFFPNVWLYGGTALSDVPSMALVVVALGLLFRGCRRRGAYFAGAVVLAVAAGFRPQNLLIGMVPALMASAHRKWRDTLLAALAGAAIVAVSYGVAIEKTGWQAYRETVAVHGDYIARTDSFRSPARPPLWRVFVEFFVRPYRMPLINVVVTLLATVSFVATGVKRRPHVVAMLAAFGPFCLFAWLMLDRYSASRFSIGYAPLLAILAADGAAIVARLAALEGLIDGALVAAMIVWSWPALRIVRTTPSPPVMAIRWIEQHVDRATPLYVHHSMAPYADALLTGFQPHYVEEEMPPLPAASGPMPLLLAEDRSDDPAAHNFARQGGRLWWIVRQRYFEVSVAPLRQQIAMKSGWYDEEREGATNWRWMGRRSVTELPARPGRVGHLALSLYVPLDVLHAAPTITVRVNGVAVAIVRAAESDLTIERDVAVQPGAPNELVIETDRVVQPPGDTRVLGVRVNGVAWR